MPYHPRRDWTLASFAPRKGIRFGAKDSHMLHPEREFVFAGKAVAVNQDTDRDSSLFKAV